MDFVAGPAGDDGPEEGERGRFVSGQAKQDDDGGSHEACLHGNANGVSVKRASKHLTGALRVCGEQ